MIFDLDVVFNCMLCEMKRIIWYYFICVEFGVYNKIVFKNSCFMFGIWVRGVIWRWCSYYYIEVNLQYLNYVC